MENHPGLKAAFINSDYYFVIIIAMSFPHWNCLSYSNLPGQVDSDPFLKAILSLVELAVLFQLTDFEYFDRNLHLILTVKLDCILASQLDCKPNCLVGLTALFPWRYAK